MTDLNGSRSAAGDTADAGRVDLRPLFPEQLVLTVDHLDGCAIVRVRGEIDLATAAQLDEAMSRAIERDGARDMTVDLAGVSFLDSTAIQLFARTSRSVRSRGGRFSLRSPSAAARRVIDLVGLADVIPIDA